MSEGLGSTLKLSPSQAQMLVEKANRQFSALDLFRPQPHQDPIFTSGATQLLVKGGNRSGKSLCTAALFSAFATDSSITLSTGQKVRIRREHERDVGRPLTCFIVAYDAQNIGRNIHRLLFEKGAFDIIRDRRTKQWRAFDYQNPDDLQRKNEARPAPPFIPARYIVPKSFSWEQKSAKIFTQFFVHNPVTKEVITKVYAFSSKAEAPQGTPCSFIFIDEQLANQDLSELAARLPDGPRGRLVWSSWPRGGDSCLLEFSRKAKEQEGQENPQLQQITLTTSGNMQIDEIGKRQFIENLTPEERIARDLGEFMTDNLKMYPIYSPDVHCAYRQCPICRAKPDAECPCKDTDDELASILRKNNGQAPRDWCRELILDPGTSNPGVLLCAVPPKDLGDYLIVLEELYPGRKDATQLAPLIKQKTGSFQYNRFIIDQNAGRQTSMGQTYSVADTYAHAFQKFGLRCKNSGSHFIFGSNNVGARIALVQEAMHLDKSGKPRLRIVNHLCPTLCKQLQETLKAESKGDPIDDRHAKGQKVDLVHCLEYWVASLPFYVEPPLENQSSDPKWKWFQAFKARNKTQAESDGVLGPQYSPARV